jgi:hypothetical protein
MEKPDAGVNSESKAAFPVWIGFKTVFHGEVRQGAHCTCRFDDLRSYQKQRKRALRATHIPQTSHSHDYNVTRKTKVGIDAVT